MVNLFDYMFWRWYCFFCKYKIFRSMEVSNAAGALFLLIGIPLGCLWGFLIWSGLLPSIGDTHGERRINALPCLIVLMFPFYYRYVLKKNITKNNYGEFRQKWGNEPLLIRRRRKWLIIALYIFNCIIFPLLLILLQILLKHN